MKVFKRLGQVRPFSQLSPQTNRQLATMQKLQYYVKDSLGEKGTQVAGGIGALALAVSAAACVWTIFGGLPGGKLTLGLLAAGWAIVPPIWFWFEYFFLFRLHGRIDEPHRWEHFKHGQQLGVAVWAGVAASMAVFANSSIADGGGTSDKDKRLDCKVQLVLPGPNAASPAGGEAFRIKCER